MQKRQTPLVLVAVLVIMLGGIGLLSAGKKDDGHQHEQPQASNDAVGQKRAAPTKEAVAKSLDKKGAADGPPDEAAVKTNRPSILKQQFGNIKPTVNEASTTNQWYTGKSHLEKDGDK